MERLRSIYMTFKGRALLAVAVSLVVYLLGLRWPFVLVVAGVFAAVLPMPRVFNTWFSRSIMGLLFLYAVLQIAAIGQLFIYPDGKFPFIAILTALLTAGIVWLFGDRKHSAGIRIANFKDLAVILGSVLFIIPFAPILAGHDSARRITEVGGWQIVDSVMHQASEINYMYYQTLHQFYGVGVFYPAGFHISTAFMEQSFFGDANDLSWSAGANLYFGQYLFLGFLMAATLIYLALTLLRNFRPVIDDRMSVITVALAVGMAMTLMHLWLFISLGFLNFFYVCMAALAAATYLLDKPLVFEWRKGIAVNVERYGWPVAAFLLLTFGASCSWPLLVPVFLLSALLAMLPLSVGDVKKHFRVFAIVLVPTVLLVLLHLLMVYLQSRYRQSNGDLVTMGGALENFNIPFLLIGLGAGMMIVIRKFTDNSNGILAVLLPYVVIVSGLMALHYGTLGEARYYVIKTSIPLEMLGIALISVYLVYALRNAGVNALTRFFCVMCVLLFVVLACIGTVKRPFYEVRGLFRNQLHAGIPPFYENDVTQIAKLGSAGKLRDFNMTALHYDPTVDRLFAHAETISWGLSVAPYGLDNNKTGLTRDCFSAQFYVLTGEVSTPASQEQLKKGVNDCIQVALDHGRKYYIVTDPASADMLRSLFPRAEVVHP